MVPNNIDIQRAKSAKKFIDKIKNHTKKGEIRKEIEALPAKIRVNGLPQCLMYLLDNDKPDRDLLGKELVEYLSKGNGGTDTERAVNLCTNQLRWATAEAFAYSRWLKLMAKAEIPKDSKPKKESDNDTFQP